MKGPYFNRVVIERCKKNYVKVYANKFKNLNGKDTFIKYF